MNLVLDISFKKKSPLLWADPDNWSSNTSSAATPHIEKIPCEHDIVCFNPHKSFSTSVPDTQINVGAIKFGDQVCYENFKLSNNCKRIFKHF